MSEKQKDRTNGGIFARVMAQLKAALAADDMSFRDIEQKIYEALRQKDPNAGWPISVYPEKGEFVYEVYNQYLEMSKYRCFMRTYTLAEDGTVTIGDEVTEVEHVSRYEPVAASESQSVAASAPCSCQQQPKAAAGKGNEMKREERIKALVSKFKNFTEAMLEGASDELIDQLEKTEVKEPEAPKTEQPKAEASTEPKVEPKTEAQVEPKAAAAKPTFEEILATASAETREMINSGLAVARARKEETIKVLKATGRCKHTDAELAALTQEQLDKLVSLAQVETPKVDFSAQNVARGSASEEQAVPAAPDLVSAMRAARGQK